MGVGDLGPFFSLVQTCDSGRISWVFLRVVIILESVFWLPGKSVSLMYANGNGA